jgi:hypothetical protein
MRLPLLWLAFCLLFAFWLAAVFLHLRGGLTTYSLVLISIVLLVRTVRAKKASKSAGLPPDE